MNVYTHLKMEYSMYVVDIFIIHPQAPYDKGITHTYC